MHKITKGIKKKIKSKKCNKGDDLFDPAELEKYRKEKEEREVEAAEGGEGVEPKEEGEEWQRFKALTAGIDSVLKKTQGDLDRIKTTSYFQRKKADSTVQKSLDPDSQETATKPPEKAKPKRWVGFEEGSTGNEEPPEEGYESTEVAQEAEVEVAGIEVPQVEEEEEEEEVDLGEDIFDTSYVDVVASGEVKLAYIPESPTDLGSTEDDPFDTSIAEKVIGPEPPIKPRPLVSLGCAVDVLTGKVKVTPPKSLTLQTSKNKRRQVPSKAPQEIDLFILDEEATDQLGAKEDNPSESEGPQSRRTSDVAIDPFGSLDETSLPNTTPIREKKTSTTQPEPLHRRSDKENESEGIIKDIVAEFDIIGETENLEEGTIYGSTSEVQYNIEQKDDDEFAALAAESIKKHPSQAIDLLSKVENNEGLEEEDPFDTSIAAGILGEFPATSVKKPPQRPPQPVSSPDVDALLGDNPLCDSSWENFQKGRSSARGPPPLRPAPPLQSLPLSISHTVDDPTQLLTNKEILSLDSACVTSLRQPHLIDSETGTKDRICEYDSTLDLTNEKDPFDTSFADVATIPGKTELRLIESEILGDSEDNDFNPRQGEEEAFDLKLGENSVEEKEIQSSVTIHISLPTEEEGAEQVIGSGPTEKRASQCSLAEEEFAAPPLQPSHRDLLGGSRTDLSQLGDDPISPDDAILGTEEQFELSYTDPFDTSIVDPKIVPGKAELKILEKELLGEITASVAGPLPKSDSDSDFNPREDEQKAHSTIANAKLSLGLSESEQQEAGINIPVELTEPFLSPSTKPDLLSTGEDIETECSKPLTPFVKEEEKKSEAAFTVDGVDPFDTAFADNILPGKAELRIIESELFGEPAIQEEKRDSLTDSEFDPRESVDKSLSVQDWEKTDTAIVTEQNHPIGAALFGASSGGNTKSRILPPSTLPLQSIANPAIVPTVSPPEIKQNQPDLLAVEEEQEESVKPLSPSRNQEETVEEGDPFDTSIVSVDVLKPGKAELKVIESELIRDDKQSAVPSVLQTTFTAQILVSHYQAGIPAPSSTIIAKTPSPEVQPPDFLLSEFDEVKSAGPKPLTPLAGSSTSLEVDEFDPFDTSIAEGIGPGKTELKVLESELIGTK